MTYFLLFACILLLVFVYVIYFIGKIPKKINWIIVYSPLVFSCFIISLYLLNGTSKPLDTRNIDYTAIGMKHYIEYTYNDSVKKERNIYTGIFKNSIGSYDEFEISNGTYQYFKSLWKKKEIEIHVDTFNNIFFIEWDKLPEHSLVYTRQEPFINYFKTSLGLYGFYEVTQKQAIDEKLFSKNRIDIINSKNILEPRQSLVYGLDITDEECRSISNVSSIDPEFRPILCVWLDSLVTSKPEDIVNHQRSFWNGGKNNEVIFCVGIDNPIDRKIKWAYSFSWSIIPDFEKYVIAESLKEGNVLDIKKYRDTLISGFSMGLWNPRNFENYKVLSLPITDFTVIISCILIGLVNILMSFRIGKKK